MQFRDVLVNFIMRNMRTGEYHVKCEVSNDLAAMSCEVSGDLSGELAEVLASPSAAPPLSNQRAEYVELAVICGADGDQADEFWELLTADQREYILGRVTVRALMVRGGLIPAGCGDGY